MANARSRPRTKAAETEALEVKTAAPLETKGEGDGKQADPAKEVETKADPKAKDDLTRLEGLIGEIKSLEAGMTDKAGERERQEQKGAIDPLTEAPLDRMAAALSQATTMLREMKARNEELEVKSQRPALDGRFSFDGDEPEQKADAIALEHKAAFGEWCRSGREDSLRALEEKAMYTLSDPDGGFFVPETLDREIEGIMLESGGFREYSDVRTIGGQRFKKMARVKGVAAEWEGERAVPADTGSPAYEMIDMGVAEMRALAKVTQTLMEDSEYDVENEIAVETADAFMLLENEAFVNGNGTDGKPKGLLTYATGANEVAWGKFQHSVSGAVDGIAGATGGDKMDKLVSFQHLLKTGYRNGAAFYGNDQTVAYLRKLRDADGHPFLTTDTATGIVNLLGMPFRVIHEFPDIASNALAIGYGQLDRTYLILDRVGLTTERFYDSNTRPNVEFYTRKRVGGGVKKFEAFKFMKFST